MLKQTLAVLIKNFNSLTFIGVFFQFSFFHPCLGQAEKCKSCRLFEMQKNNTNLKNLNADFLEKELDFYNEKVNQKANNEEIFIFISFSVPLQIWKELDQAARKLGAVFVLRGIPKNSFTLFAKKVYELRKYIESDIIIDPEKFKECEIDAVSVVLVVKNGKFDKVSGALSLEKALEIIKVKGDVSYAK